MVTSERDSVLLRNSSVLSLLQNSAENSHSACAVVALTSARPGSGVTYTAHMLTNSLNREHPGSAIYVDGRELSNAALLSDGKTVVSEMDDMSLHKPVTHRQSWRSSPALRKAYVAALRERSSYVLIDCPSIVESSDALFLAPTVDGVISVVEADATTKTQITHLEQTITRCGGTILGHVLNKRRYVIPEWIYQKLQALGV